MQQTGRDQKLTTSKDAICQAISVGPADHETLKCSSACLQRAQHKCQLRMLCDASFSRLMESKLETVISW